MPTFLRAVLVAAIASCLLGACVTSERLDTDAIDSTVAYLALMPRLTVGSTRPKTVDLNLICFDTAKVAKTVYVPAAANDQVTVVKVAPGACYLSAVRFGPFSASFLPGTTAFEAHGAQVNYPGDWAIELRPRATVYVPGGYTDESEVKGSVTCNPASLASIKAAHPRLASTLPIECTGPGKI